MAQASDLCVRYASGCRSGDGHVDDALLVGVADKLAVKLGPALGLDPTAQRALMSRSVRGPSSWVMRSCARSRIPLLMWSRSITSRDHHQRGTMNAGRGVVGVPVIDRNHSSFVPRSRPAPSVRG